MTTPSTSNTHVVAAARRAFDRRVLTLWLIALALPTLVVLLPAMRLLAPNVNYSLGARALPAHLDLNAITDLLNRGGLVEGIGAAALAASVLFAIVLPWLHGVAVTAARLTGPLTWKGLLAGANEEYWRMLRLSLLSLLLFGILMMLAGQANDMLEDAESHAIVLSTLTPWTILSWVVTILVYLFIEVTLEGARAYCAAFPRRRSVLHAWFGALRLLRREPKAILASFLPLTVVGLLIGAVLMLCRLELNQASSAGLIAAFVLSEAFAVTMGWMHCARIVALTQLLRRPL